MTRRRRYFSGYTLIEVLVAMAIFSAMVTLAAMALDQGLKQYRGLMEKGVNFWEKARYVWINGSFGAVLDYYIYRQDIGWAPYFIGDGEMVSYVSLSPLAGDLPVAVWIVKEKQDNGLFDVVYYELPVYTKKYADLYEDYVDGNYKHGNSLRILEGVQDITMEFFGFDALKHQGEWSQSFDGAQRRSLPSAVKLTYTLNDKKGIMLFCINTNSTRKVSYNE